ncbi:MAG: hypothetical protein UV68_C0011G0004 [Candidatus Collierbacteria bacterium GW2011_GWC2_43_12]|uniref:Uncharacterized protein n=1 Tax=Candidatus Collierbacteria bacterium GW2011_GWC2_43_12 TaxID=1618390 RepID=A0A0G1G658_9BACT|nr:MAG: hypothetical protein UV68_C0011G0004 [Candidatus Collierbacteria bacterium GW2011_GWC2_43_12]
MDNKTLIRIVEELQVSVEIKNLLKRYIDGNNDDPELGEKVAKILDTLADQADMAASELEKMIEKLDAFREETINQGDDFVGKIDDLTNTYGEEMIAVLKEANKGNEEPVTSTQEVSSQAVSVETPMDEPTTTLSQPTYSQPMPVQSVQASTPLVTNPAPFPTTPLMGGQTS